MSSVINFLKNLLLINLVASLFERTKTQFKDVKPFSWQVSLLLSALAWMVFLVVQEDNAKRFVSLYGWFFLIVGIDWYFTDDKDNKKKLNLPGLDIKINYGPWLSGALLATALYTNQFLIRDLSTAFVSWPLLAVAIAALPRFIRHGPSFKPPDDEAVRQQLVHLVLIGLLISCWFQFHFSLQALLRNYPAVLQDDFSESLFVVPIVPNFGNTNASRNQGVALLNNTEARIRQELNGRSWAEVQNWLRNVSFQLPLLSQEIKDTVFDRSMPLDEQRFWQLNASYETLPNNKLRLQAIWKGPSSRNEGYMLEKTCDLRPSSTPTPSPTPSTNPAVPETSVSPRASYVMECSPVHSSAASIVAPVESAN